MNVELKKSITRSIANIVAGTILGIGRLVYAILSMIFGILMSLAG